MSTSEQGTRSNYRVRIYRRLLCDSTVGKPKHYSEPTPIKREDRRTSTFERGVKLLRRATSLFTGSPQSAK